MPENQTTALAVTKTIDGSQQLALPDYMGGAAPDPMLDTVRGSIPRIMIAQSLTPEVDSGEVKAGSYFTRPDVVSLGSKFQCVCVAYTHEWQLWGKHDPSKKQRPIWRYPVNATPAEAPDVDGSVQEFDYFTRGWEANDGNPPRASEAHNFCLVLYDEASGPQPQFGVLSLAKTSGSSGAQLAGLLKRFTMLPKRPPMWGAVLTLETVKEKNDKGVFYVAQAQRVGIVANEAHFKALTDMAKAVTPQRVAAATEAGE